MARNDETHLGLLAISKTLGEIVAARSARMLGPITLAALAWLRPKAAAFCAYGIFTDG